MPFSQLQKCPIESFAHLKKFYIICPLLVLLLFSHPVVFDSLWPHLLQHARPRWPSPSPEVCPSSHQLHQWCHLAISSSDTLVFSCPQSFPASGTFTKSQWFASVDQNTGAFASASVLPMSIQGWFPWSYIDWFGLPAV